MTKKLFTHVLPWLITAVALYIAFKGVDWSILLGHIGDAHPAWVALAVALTTLSYLMRARRWQLLFVDVAISFADSLRVLILGFFMNNVLPARTGELVRAHMGSKVTGQTRTLVLASVAAERLADGVTLSVFFVLFALHLGDARMSTNLTYVAVLFGGASVGVIVTLLIRRRLFAFAERLNARFQNRFTDYLANRFQVFVNGLSPLCTPRRAPILTVWSIAIWCVELFVYYSVSRAYDTDLGVGMCVLFLVAVNFSSLIPAAPGGIGVIEAVGSAVLVSIGVPKELALTMVITQHAIQYLVVGVPGALVLLRWRRRSEVLQAMQSADGQPAQRDPLSASAST